MSSLRSVTLYAEEVRAVLANGELQFRRVIKKPHIITEEEDFDARDCWVDNEGGLWGVEDALHICPFGQPGDLLRVKETWTELDPRHHPPRWVYRADHTDGDGERCRQDYIDAGYPYQWKSSTQMPQHASRITLELTDVRAEPLQKITRRDVRAEGVPDTWGDWTTLPSGIEDGHVWDNMTYVEQFTFLWDSRKANRNHPWASKPWVWVGTAKRVDAE